MTGPYRPRNEPALIIGVFLLLLGGAFLLRNSGLFALDWDVVWPLLLIALGVVVVAGAMRGGGGRGSGETSVSIPMDGARRLDLSLRLGAGRYRLAGGATGLVDVSANDATIGAGADRAGDLARVRLWTSVDRWRWGWRGDHEWRMAVASDVPTALDVQAGAGLFELDLSAIAITSARVGIGAADLRVVLPRPRGDVPIRVEGGAAQFTFRVPAGVEARVATTGLVTTSGPSETAGYASAADRVTVDVVGGAAAVRIVHAA